MNHFMKTGLPRLRRVLSVLVLACLVSGCTSARKRMSPGLGVPTETYRPGVTHRDEVLADMGPPHKMTVLPEGYAFMYESVDTLELQLGFSIPVPVLRWFKIISANADYSHRVLFYQFDAQDRLVASDDEDTRFDLGDTLAVQPVVSVKLAFDTSSVENEVVDIQQWPAFCLQPLPQTLNRANAVNTGVAGIERRGTAPYAGQRSTEMHQ